MRNAWHTESTPDNPDHHVRHWHTTLSDDLPFRHCRNCGGRGVIGAHYLGYRGERFSLPRAPTICSDCGGRGLEDKEPLDTPGSVGLESLP